jgi:hypothetical protein
MPAIRRCALHFLSHSERVRGVHYGTAPFQTQASLRLSGSSPELECGQRIDTVPFISNKPVTISTNQTKNKFFV